MFENWHLKRNADNIVWLSLDKKNATVNSLSEDVLKELSTLLTQLAADKETGALVIRSAKKTGFIAGADIEQFEHLKTSEQATHVIRRGQLILEQLANLPFPTIRSIDVVSLIFRLNC